MADANDTILDPDNLAGETVEFWASSADALLQDFLIAVTAGDRLKIVLAGARVAQMAASMADWFKDGTVALCRSKEEVDQAQAVCRQVAQMAQNRMDRIYERTAKSDPPKLTPTPDRSAN